ncbi:MAG: DUF3313 domain-containing protein [Betaproteobacteria bacterium]|nr:MAG: DUF3313 domain-containing protein [Betaproteobacteria bacterium]
MKTAFKAALLALAFTAGVAGAQEPAASKPQYSGFLNDYSKLQPAADREGVQLFLDRSRDYRSYTKVMFDPVEVYLTPNPDYKGLQPDALKRMTDTFQSAFKKALGSDYQVVDAPGPGVLRVRAAITGVQATKPPLGATDFIPIKAIFNIGRAAAGASPQVAEMTAEMEVLDEKGARVAAAVATRKGDKTLPQRDTVTWKDLEPITNYWAIGFKQRLDEVRGVKPKP